MKTLMDKDILINEYCNNFKSIHQIAKEYNVGRGCVRNSIEYYNIKKYTKTEREALIKDKYQKILNKEVFQKEYQSLTIQKISDKYNVPLIVCIELRKKYGITKQGSTYQSDKREQLKNITYDYLYNEYIIKKIPIYEIAANTKHSQRSISMKLKELGIQQRNKTDIIKETLMSRYGVDNPVKIPEAFEKMKETNNAKYGVPYGIFTDNCIKNPTTNNNSKPNLYFQTLLENNDIQYEREYRLANRSFDFKVGECLIEIDPFPTHNTTWGYKNKQPILSDYHLLKTKLAEENGFKCIHVFDWDDNLKIINLLRAKKKIFARNCLIKEITKNEMRDFLNKNHLQGYCSGQKIILGLFYNNTLVEAMSFGKPRYNNKYEYELLRLCSASNYIVVGGTNKLFKYFLTKYNPKSIVSYCDNSKFTGSVYSQLGFKLIRKNKPSKHWFSDKNMPYHITDNMLRKLGYDKIFNTAFGKNTNNEDLMRKAGYVEIYDCGQSTWVYKK